jgi:hypothetical protein
MLQIDGQNTEPGRLAAIISTTVVSTTVVSTTSIIPTSIRLTAGIVPNIIVDVAGFSGIIPGFRLFPRIYSILPSPIRLPVPTVIVTAPDGKQKHQHPQQAPPQHV